MPLLQHGFMRLQAPANVYGIRRRRRHGKLVRVMKKKPEKQDMKDSPIIKLLKAGASALLLSFPLFMLTTCGRPSGTGGSASSYVPADEVSALYGINETAGVFDVSVDAAGDMIVTPASPNQ